MPEYQLDYVKIEDFYQWPISGFTVVFYETHLKNKTYSKLKNVCGNLFPILPK